jgi:hypothetical protein
MYFTLREDGTRLADATHAASTKSGDKDTADIQNAVTSAL